MSSCRTLLRSVLAFAPLLSGGSQGSRQSTDWRGVDLRIGVDSGVVVPSVSLFDVWVQNVGELGGAGFLSVDVISSVGTVLARVGPPDTQSFVRVPAFSMGGREGIVIRLHPAASLLRLIDEMDRRGEPYSIRATVSPRGPDANMRNNVRERHYNEPILLLPGTARTVTMIGRASSGQRVRWITETTSTTLGWTVIGPDQPTAAVLTPASGELLGTLTVSASPRLAHGSVLSSRVVLLDASTDSILYAREWVAAFDTVPPTIRNVRFVIMADRTIAVQAMAGDQETRLDGRQGLVAEYSVDSSRTWSTANCLTRIGERLEPMTAEFVVGPFPTGAQVSVRLVATDGAGNRSVAMPDDASLFEAPPHAERLLRNKQPMTKPSGSSLFDIERLQQMGAVSRSPRDTTETRPPLVRPAQTVAEQRLVVAARRKRDYRAEIDSLTATGVDVSQFRRIEWNPAKGGLPKKHPTYVEVVVP